MRTSAFIFLILIVGSSWATNSHVQVARYTSVAPVPSSVERDPLSSVVTMVFPNRIQKLNEAFDYLMLRTGYKMAPIENSDPLLPILLISSVPEVHREIGPISIEDAMKTLAGEPWEFIIDPVNRYVSFELKPKYRDGFETDIAMPSITSDESIEIISPTADDEIGLIANEAGNNLAQASTPGLPLVKHNYNDSEDMGLKSNKEKRLAKNLQALDLEGYRNFQKEMLNESVALNMRSVEMDKVLGELMPNNWKIDIQVDDPTIRFAKFDLTSQNTRRTVLQDFLTPLGLKIDFYPAIQPQPLAVVSGK